LEKKDTVHNSLKKAIFQVILNKEYTVMMNNSINLLVNHRYSNVAYAIISMNQ